MSSLKVHKNTNAYYFILELIMWPSSFKTCHLTVKSRRAHFAMRRRQNISDSQAQECEGHMISFKTLRSHGTRELHNLMHSGNASNGINCR